MILFVFWLDIPSFLFFELFDIGIAPVAARAVPFNFAVKITIIQ